MAMMQKKKSRKSVLGEADLYQMNPFTALTPPMQGSMQDMMGDRVVDKMPVKRRRMRQYGGLA